MAKAFLISPEDKSIESIELSDVNEVAAPVGYDTIEQAGSVGNGADRLFFDEECFIVFCRVGSGEYVWSLTATRLQTGLST